jgi:hypothetical protein
MKGPVMKNSIQRDSSFIFCSAVMLGAILVSLSANAFGGMKKVHIKLDYRQQKQWKYNLDYHSDCVIEDKDSVSRVRTNVACMLSASPGSRGDRLTFVVDSVSVYSEFYNEEKQNSIAQKLNGGQFGVALIDGCPIVDTLTSFSVSEISEWDLVIQFAKLLPDVPDRPVRKGYVWENSGVFPIMSNIGKVDCEVYRVYKIDSLTLKDNYAYISWQFRYAAINTSGSVSRMMEKVPVSGKGSGVAVVDVAGKKLLKAQVKFLTPVATYGSTKVNWEENTTLKYISDSETSQP